MNDEHFYKWGLGFLIGFTLIFYFLSYQLYIRIKAHPNLNYIEIMSMR